MCSWRRWRKEGSLESAPWCSEAGRVRRFQGHRLRSRSSRTAAPKRCANRMLPRCAGTSSRTASSSGIKIYPMLMRSATDALLRTATRSSYRCVRLQVHLYDSGTNLVIRHVFRPRFPPETNASRCQVDVKSFPLRIQQVRNYVFPENCTCLG